MVVASILFADRVLLLAQGGVTDSIGLQYGVAGLLFLIATGLAKMLSDERKRYDQIISDRDKEFKEAMVQIANDYKTALEQVQTTIQGQTNAITKNTNALEQVATLSSLKEFIRKEVGGS
jgi:xylose isomerase